jgi:hypothetical protein
MLLADIINSMIQAIIFSYSTECCIRNLVSQDYVKISQILIIYVLYVLFLYLCVKYIDKSIKLYKSVVEQKTNIFVWTLSNG